MTSELKQAIQDFSLVCDIGNEQLTGDMPEYKRAMEVYNTIECFLLQYSNNYESIRNNLQSIKDVLYSLGEASDGQGNILVDSAVFGARLDIKSVIKSLGFGVTEVRE